MFAQCRCCFTCLCFTLSHFHNVNCFVACSDDSSTLSPDLSPPWAWVGLGWAQGRLGWAQGRLRVSSGWARGGLGWAWGGLRVGSGRLGVGSG